jgi:hypothetical protein
MTETGHQGERHGMRDIGANDARHRHVDKAAQEPWRRIASAPTEEIETRSPIAAPTRTVNRNVLLLSKAGTWAL